MMIEWQIGGIVKIKVEPACPSEFGAHGTMPNVNGLLGYISDEDERVDQHNFGVTFRGVSLHPKGHATRMWFKASEMELQAKHRRIYAHQD